MKFFLFTNKGIRYLVLSLLLVYFVEYFVLSINSFSGSHFPIWFNVSVYLLVSVLFFVKYRRNNLFCFELMFVPVYFVGMFYDDLLSFMWEYADSLSLIGNSNYITKSAIIQMIAFLCFMYGATVANKKRYVESSGWDGYYIYGKLINYKAATYFLTFLLVVVVLNIYRTGGFATWNKYQHMEFSGEDEYQGLGHITILTTLLSIIEFIRIAKMNVHSFWEFLKKSNKIYLVITLSVTAAVIYTGKRSAALLVLLPMIASYVLFVKKLTNRQVISGAVLGGVLMIVAGLSRNTGSMEGQVINLATSTRDFSMTNADCTYLIKYTDEHGLYLFESLIPSLLSGVPIIGPIIVNAVFSGPQMGSSIVCTQGLGGVFSTSGWGTSLVGDLYYNGGFTFVIIYMFLIGWGMSYLYNRFAVRKEFDAFLFIVYIVMTANAIFSYRSAFDFIYGTVLYAAICLLITSILFPLKKTYSTIRTPQTKR